MNQVTKSPDNPFIRVIKRLMNWLAANPTPVAQLPPFLPPPKKIKIKVTLIRETVLKSGNENIAASIVTKHYVSVYDVYDNERENYVGQYYGNSEENAKMIYDAIIQQKGLTKNQETLSETIITL